MPRPRGSLLALALIANACSSQNPAAPVAPTLSSSALTGSLSVFSTKGDDFGYTVTIAVHTGATSSATITSADITILTGGGPIRLVTQPFTAPIPAGAGAQSKVVVANEGGRPYASTVTARITYTDDAGRSGSFETSANVPSCLAYYFYASCLSRYLDLGQSVGCDGDLQYVCTASNYPLAGSSIQWESSAPDVAAVSADGRLNGKQEGKAKITGRYGFPAPAMTFNVCVGLLCRPQSLRVSGNDTLLINGRGSVGAYGMFADGENKVTAVATWTSSDPSIVRVEPGTSSLRTVTALQTGTAVISATFLGVTATMPITVVRSFGP